MKKTVVLFVLLFSLCAVAKDKNSGDFPLTVHITAVNAEQGQAGVYGSGSTDSNGNYSSSVSGGGSYTWKLYTAQIEGDKKTYGLSTDRMHYKGGKGLAVATMGWSAIATAKRNYWLEIGDYRGRWNKDGTLEIQFTAKGKPTHQTFRIESEESTPAPSLSESTRKALIDNTEAGQTSPAAAAALAIDGHILTPQEKAQLIQTGQGSRCAIITNPAGAEVYIDGNKGSVTPMTFILAKRDNPRTITIKLAGYKTVEKTVVPDGKDIPISITMEKDER